MQKIVVLGDSLSSGHGIATRFAFPSVLQQRLDDARFDYTVVNEGISGDTSAGGVRRIAAALGGDVRLLVLALGINDGLRGIPVAQVKRNLAAIIETAQARGVPVLLCRMEALPLYGWDYVTAFHRMYDELAAEHRVTLAPFFLLKVIGNPLLMLPDHMHPNASGAKVIADCVWPHLLLQLKKIA